MHYETQLRKNHSVSYFWYPIFNYFSIKVFTDKIRFSGTSRGLDPRQAQVDECMTPGSFILWQDLRYGARMLWKKPGLHIDCGIDAQLGDRREYGDFQRRECAVAAPAALCGIGTAGAVVRKNAQG
jgi:hypothetical protein